MRKYLVILFFISFLGYSQEKIDINLICNEWKLIALEKNGNIKLAEEFDKKESLIFYKNKKFKMNDSEGVFNGVWRYDSEKNIIELHIIEFNKKIYLKIISLSSDKMSYVYYEEDEKIIFHLVLKTL